MSLNPSPPTATTPNRGTTTMPGKGSDSFVHLHVHTEYSMLDGAARIGDLFTRAGEMGMPALATTDHGYVFGAYSSGRRPRPGVKPISSSSIAPREHTARQDPGQGAREHDPGKSVRLWRYTHELLARDNTGCTTCPEDASSLDKVTPVAARRRELLAGTAGLIGMKGCASG